jgi:hypothetical protein
MLAAMDGGYPPSCEVVATRSKRFTSRCFIGISYPSARVYNHYLWILICGLIITLGYTSIAVRILTLANDLEGKKQRKQLISLVRGFAAFPIIFCVCYVPILQDRFRRLWGGSSVTIDPVQPTIWIAMLMLNGLANSLLIAWKRSWGKSFGNRTNEHAVDQRIRQNKILQIVGDEKSLQLFHNFLETKRASENLRFFLAIRKYESSYNQQSGEERRSSFESIVNDFIVTTAPLQVNLPAPMRRAILEHMNAHATYGPYTFCDTKEHVLQILATDGLFAFQKSKFYKQMEENVTVQNIVASAV